MSDRRFVNAIYRNEGITEEISLTQINTASYSEKYKGKLFCPNPKCHAKLKYVERNQGTIKLLSAIDISEHVNNCPYYLEYKKYDTDRKLERSFSTEHIRDALKRQIKKIGASKDFIKRPPTIPSRSKKRNSTQTEPHINGYLCDDVCNELVGKPLCITGIVNSIHIVEKEGVAKHAYINFLTNNDKKVSVLINTRLWGSDPKIENYIMEIEAEQETLQHDRSKKYYCSCFGRVDKVSKGFNIVPAIIDAVITAVVDNMVQTT